MKNDFEDIKRIVSEAGLESPSADFLQSVMIKVEEHSMATSRVKYSPLITKKGWLLLGVIVLGIVVSLLFFDGSGDSWLSAIAWPEFSLDTILGSKLSFQLYNTTIYGLVFLGALFAIQVIFLNQKIKNDFSV